ncbi:MAG: AAA family ATPase [Phycisphaerales bacterium]
MTAAMKLVAFKVTSFRSVHDSGWITTDEVTALIGTNESGKTNLLIPLWKLNPANEGAINLLADAPRKDYNSIRAMEEKPDFIHARFSLSDKLTTWVASKTGKAIEQVRIVEVSRDFDEQYTVHFPHAQDDNEVPAEEIRNELDEVIADIEESTPSGKADDTLKATLLTILRSARSGINNDLETLSADEIAELAGKITATAIEDAPTRSTIAPRFGQIADRFTQRQEHLTKPGPDENQEVIDLIINRLPSFVYYSTYGNLDSEIYLPHVIDDLKREDLSGKAEARARTLRVLFSFVRLKPQEILELGKDWSGDKDPTDEDIEQLNEQKKERSVLLQSAGTELTTKFRNWWKQGEYRIRFEADGNHFRIWVSDDRRPEEIELEGRSTGLQWFLSFYLIFLVESRSAHNGSILLLDEPGHSLHPIAQKFLAVFFESLAASNQLLYTTHSPFLVDADHLDRVRAVYVDGEGYTSVSTNLRAGQEAARSNSIYPVHAALGLSVSDTLFQGCRPVVVEGQSDQLYMSAIKNVLIALGRFQPRHELLFVPTTGVKAIKTVAAILGGRDENLPYVLCDADAAGRTLAKTLKDDFYKDHVEHVVTVEEFTGLTDTEVEDLFPSVFMTPILDRFLKGPDDYAFQAQAGSPIVAQVKTYADQHKIELDKGWKVELAKLIKARLKPEILTGADWEEALEKWVRLFEKLDPR